MIANVRGVRGRGVGMLAVLFALVLAAACERVSELPFASPGARTTCVPSPEDLLPWARFHERPLTAFPYMATYSACGKKLVYVAARHQADGRSPTHHLVIKAFEGGDPDPRLVIVEGYVSSTINQPAALTREADLAEDDGSDSEALLAIRLATTLGADFIGGEAPDHYTRAGLTPLGYGPDDQMNFHILRSIERWLREDREPDHRMLDLASHIAAVSANMDPSVRGALDDPLTADGFKAWYKAMNGISFDEGYQRTDAYFTHPRFDRPSADLARAVADIRDRHILETIADGLARYDTVIVVYGGGHHVVQARALEKALGVPVITRL